MEKNMTVTVEEGDLVVRFKLQEPTVSSTGKSRLVASTGGWKETEAVVHGLPVKLTMAAIIPLR